MKKLLSCASSVLFLCLFANLLMAQTPSKIARDPSVIAKKIQAGNNATDDTFKVWNDGSGTLSYSIGNNDSAEGGYIIKYSPNVGINWVKNITPLIGSSTDATQNTHTITYNTAGLPDGIYQATVYIVNIDSLEGGIYSDVKTVVITIKVGIPKLAHDVPKRPWIKPYGDPGNFVGDMPTIIQYGAYMGDGLPGSSKLAWAPAPYTFNVENAGGSQMKYFVSVTEDKDKIIDSITPGKGIVEPNGSSAETIFFAAHFLPTGTYKAMLTITAYDANDMTTAIDSPQQIKVVLRVGPEVYVNTWFDYNAGIRRYTGGWEPTQNGPNLSPIAGCAREDQEPSDLFGIYFLNNAYGGPKNQQFDGNVDNRRNATGLPLESVIANPETNSNMLHFTINRGGDLGGTWIKAEVKYDGTLRKGLSGTINGITAAGYDCIPPNTGTIVITNAGGQQETLDYISWTRPSAKLTKVVPDTSFTVSGLNITPPNTGLLYLQKSNNVTTTKEIPYTAYSINGNDLTFTVAKTGDYGVGDTLIMYEVYSFDIGTRTLKYSYLVDDSCKIIKAQSGTIDRPGTEGYGKKVDIKVEYDTSDIPVYPPTNPTQPGIARLTGYIYVRANDYFGNDAANHADDENDPRYKDMLWLSNIVKVNLVVRGPTIATSNNSFSQTIAQGSNANTQTFDIWNLYGVGRLHYSVNVEGAVLPDGTKWLMVSDSDPNHDSDNEQDKNRVTLTYNASGLKTGTYTAKIIYTDQNATNSPYVVNVTLRVLGPVIATDKTELNPVCVVGENATNDTEFKVWNADEKDNPPGYQGSTLQYSILTSVDSGPMWFTCEPVKGDSTGPADKDTIKVSYLTSALSRGSYHGTITVYNVNDGSTKKIDVNLLVRAPMIAISQMTFQQKCDIGTDAGTQSFQIWNSGDVNTVLDYSISDNVDWLKINPSDGISTGDNDRKTIYLNYSTSSLPAGIHNAKITIKSGKAPNSPVEIPVTLEVRAPSIALSTTALFPTCLKGYDAKETTFEVWNGGSATLNYSISSNETWVVCSPISGDSKGVNDKDSIKVTYNTSDAQKFPPGTYPATITVSAPQASNNPQKIAVTLVVQEPKLKTNKEKIEALAELGGYVAPQAFEIWNEKNGNLKWSLEIEYVKPSSPPGKWLALDPTNGNSGGEHDQVTIFFNSANLTAGVYEAKVKVTGKDDNDKEVIGSPIEVAVTLTIGPRVGINLDPPELNPECEEGKDATAQVFTVKNIGVGILNYTITDDVEWLSCNPTAGQSSGENDTITVNYATKDLPAGLHKGKILITNVDTGDITTINVNLRVKNGSKIALSTDALNPTCAQGTNAPNDKFTVKNSGLKTLNYTIEAGEYAPVDKVGWIAKIDPNTGSSTGEEDEITVEYSTATLDIGTYTAKIKVSAPAAENTPQEILVTLTVLGPTIGIEPKSISASCPKDQSPPPTSFDVWNVGGGVLDYTITADVDWLECSPTSGTSSGEHDKISVTFKTASLPVGIHNGNITITAQGATNNPQTIPVTVRIGLPTIALSANSLSPVCVEGKDADPQTFQVWNSGNGTLNFTISIIGEKANWLACNPKSGTSTGSADKKTIEVSYTTANLPIGTYKAEIKITDNQATNSPQIIAVNLTVSKEIPTDELVLHLTASVDNITKDIKNKVCFWPDISPKKTNSASQYTPSKQPLYQDKENGINNLPVIEFKKSSMNLLDMPNNGINNSVEGSFAKKTIFMVFKTGEDITTKQTLIAQGSKNRGINIYISNKKLYLGAWNIKNEGPESGWTPKFVSVQLLPNTVYLIDFILDSTNKSLSAYLNGNLIGIEEGIGKLYNDTTPLSLGAALGKVAYSPEDTNGEGESYTGLIAEILYYNTVLDEANRKGIENSLISKYAITAPEIVARGLAFRLRADSQIVNDKNNAVLVKSWSDISSISKKSPLLKQSSAKKQPTIGGLGEKELPYIRYDASNRTFMIASPNAEINSSKNSYPERTVFAILETKSDITSPQVVWTEGDKNAGMNIFIQDGRLYIGVWGLKAPSHESNWGPLFLSKAVSADTKYCVQFILNQPENYFTGYLNGDSMGKYIGVGKLFKHSPGAMGAAVSASNLNGVWAKKAAYLSGDIFEMLIYNATLTNEENVTMRNYFKNRYNINFSE